MRELGLHLPSAYFRVGCLNYKKQKKTHEFLVKMGTETHVNIRLAVDRVNNSILCQGLVNNKQPRLFTPGEVVTHQHGFMKVRELLFDSD